jgi:hypothetical protein
MMRKRPKELPKYHIEAIEPMPAIACIWNSHYMRKIMGVLNSRENAVPVG